MKIKPTLPVFSFWFCRYRALFATLCLTFAADSGLAADVNVVVLLKEQRFYQTGPDFVALRESDDTPDDKELAFKIFVEGNEIISLQSATLLLPDGTTTIPLVRENPEDSELQHEYQTDVLLDLNTQFPNGSYRVSLSTQNDGEQSIELNLQGDTYPPVPKVINYQDLQTIGPESATTVQWSPMGGSNNDFIMFSVYDEQGEEIWSTPMPGQLGALDGTAVQGVTHYRFRSNTK